jgi:hypothetical protein
MPHTYPPFNVHVRTPELTLVGASDDVLERLIPVIRDGVVGPGHMPFDDPMSLYEDSRSASGNGCVESGRDGASRPAMVATGFGE